MILGVVCSLCLTVAPGTPVRSNLPHAAPQIRLVDSQPQDTLAQRVYDVVATEHPMAVEVGNEPNLPRYWGATITPAAYATIYRQARNAARWADPNVPVISAGIADAGNWKSWIKVIAKEHPDYIGLHPYIAPAQDAHWTLHYGPVAVTEIGISINAGDEAYRRDFLNSVIYWMGRYGVWATMLYSPDDPNWPIPAGVLEATP